MFFSKCVAIFFLIFLLPSWASGQEPLHVTGDIIIPGTVEKKPYKYKVTITFDVDQITIICEKKIFQPFNRFFSPRVNNLRLYSKELLEIDFDKKNHLIIFPCDSLYQRYRNYFHPIREVLSYIPWHHAEIERPGLIFSLDNVAEHKPQIKKLFDSLNKKNNNTPSSESRIFLWENGAKIYQD